MTRYNRPDLELPWHVDHLGGSTKCIYTSGGWYVADVWEDKDAEFIVQACNEYSSLTAEILQLRAALDEALNILQIALPAPHPWPTESVEYKLRIYHNMAVANG